MYGFTNLDDLQLTMRLLHKGGIPLRDVSNVCVKATAHCLNNMILFYLILMLTVYSYMYMYMVFYSKEQSNFNVFKGFFFSLHYKKITAHYTVLDLISMGIDTLRGTLCKQNYI